VLIRDEEIAVHSSTSLFTSTLLMQTLARSLFRPLSNRDATDTYLHTWVTLDKTIKCCGRV